MAKLKSLLKIEGTLDELTFYKTQDGHLVRTKGGVSAKRIATDPAFLRTRENGAEFANSTTAGKLLRDALRSLTGNASDNRIVSRIVKLMTQIKNMDQTSVRGKRNVGVGVLRPEAQNLLLNLEFNANALLAGILLKQFTVDTAAGSITIPDLAPVNDIAFPAGATHVTISGAFAVVDFVSGTSALALTNAVNLDLTSGPASVNLAAAALPAGSGTMLGLIKMEFFQEINAVQYSLRNGAYNALAIVSVS